MKREFNIKIKMDERWVNPFCSFLRDLERCSDIGHSAVIAFYADGDGSFKAKFDINTEFVQNNGFDPSCVNELERVYAI